MPHIPSLFVDHRIPTTAKREGQGPLLRDVMNRLVSIVKSGRWGGYHNIPQGLLSTHGWIHNTGKETNPTAQYLEAPGLGV